MFYREAKAMKKTVTIREIEYRGADDISGFVVSFQVQLLTALKKRGLLTQQQYEKSLSILKERK